MKIYKFIVTARHGLYGTKISEHYIAADSYEQAAAYVKSVLDEAGWKVERMDETDILLMDIREADED